VPASKSTTRRRVRHVDVWSVFKISLLFFFVCGIVWLVAAIILWNVVAAFGFVSQLESLAGKLAGGSFKLDSGSLLRAAVLIDVVVVFGFALTATLLAVLYNLISDVVGGLTFTVEEMAEGREGKLLSRLSLPFGRNRQKAAVEGLGAAKPAPTQRRPAAAAVTKTPAGPKAPPAAQPTRPPAGTGAVAVKRAAQPRVASQPRTLGGDSKTSPQEPPQQRPRPGRDTASVAPIPPETKRKP